MYCGLHADLVGTEYHDWKSDIKQDAYSLLHAIASSDFIAGFSILYTLLNPLEGIRVLHRNFKGEDWILATPIKWCVYSKGKYNIGVHVCGYISLYEYR